MALTPAEEAELQQLLSEEAKVPSRPSPGKLESLGRGAAQGVSFGFGDELSGAVAAGAQKLGLAGEGVDPSFQMTPGEAYKSGRDAARESDDAAQEAHGKLFGAGRIGGAVLGSVVPVGQAGKALGGIAKAAGGGAKGLAAAGAVAGSALGAVSGAGDAKSLKPAELAKSMAIEGGLGAVGGGILGPLAPLVGKAVASGGRKVVDAVRGAPAAARSAGEAAAPFAGRVVEAAEANPLMRVGAFGATGGKSEGVLGVARRVAKMGQKADPFIEALRKLTPDLYGAADDAAPILASSRPAPASSFDDVFDAYVIKHGLPPDAPRTPTPRPMQPKTEGGRGRARPKLEELLEPLAQSKPAPVRFTEPVTEGRYAPMKPTDAAEFRDVQELVNLGKPDDFAFYVNKGNRVGADDWRGAMERDLTPAESMRQKALDDLLVADTPPAAAPAQKAPRPGVPKPARSGSEIVAKVATERARSPGASVEEMAKRTKLRPADVRMALMQLPL